MEMETGKLKVQKVVFIQCCFVYYACILFFSYFFQPELYVILKKKVATWKTSSFTKKVGGTGAIYGLIMFLGENILRSLANLIKAVI